MNLVQIIDVGLLVNAKVNGTLCNLVHKYAYFDIKILLHVFCILNKFITLMFIGFFRWLCKCGYDNETVQAATVYQVLK